MKLIRLFIAENKLEKEQILNVSGNNFDYLIKVMRKKINDEILVFNGIDGEFLGKIINISKKDCVIDLIAKKKDQEKSSNITLAFAPVKNVRIDFVAAKATEMGVNKFQPIITQHSIVDKINEDRFTANIKEASEQCERLDLPELAPIVKLTSYLKKIDETAILLLCDESGKAEKASLILSKIKQEKDREIIIFVGPEGGFSKDEFSLFYDLKNLHSISLGKRILRSDTAIISALALVNEFLF